MTLPIYAINEIVVFLYSLVFLIILYFNLYNLNSISFKEIVIKDYRNISQLFINSVDLFNKRIKVINKAYRNLNKYKGKTKAIVSLLYYSEIKNFIDSNYIFLKQNYHDKLIFYVTENITTTEKYRNIQYTVIDISFSFFTFPYNFNKTAYKPHFQKRGKWNYQHMCRFFFRDIFLHPSLFDVDIYMRLDSESVLNTTINLFLFMKDNIVYMHNRIMNDAASVVKGLKEYTHSLVKTLEIKAIDKASFDRSFIRNALIYYNNFEICRMKFFRSRDMLQFATLVDLSYGQFIYRWGDAPLRYISLSLYSNSKSKISIPRNVKYCHRYCIS